MFLIFCVEIQYPFNICRVDNHYFLKKTCKAHTLGKTFAGREFCEVKNFRDKLSQMISNDAFCKNLTFANVYFKCWNLIIFRHIQANLFQISSSWSSKFISRGKNFHDFYKNIFHGSNFSQFVQNSQKSRKFLPLKYIMNVIMFIMLY